MWLGYVVGECHQIGSQSDPSPLHHSCPPSAMCHGCCRRLFYLVLHNCEWGPMLPAMGGPNSRELENLVYFQLCMTSSMRRLFLASQTFPSHVQESCANHALLRARHFATKQRTQVQMSWNMKIQQAIMGPLGPFQKRSLLTSQYDPLLEPLHRSIGVALRYE